MTLNKSCSFAIAVLLLCCGKAQAQTARQWRDSLAVLGRQIDASPHSVDLRLKKAAVNLELGQWDYAVTEFGIVLEKEPQNLAALFYRAYANTQLRRYELALDDYHAFIRIAPVNIEARLGLAHTYEKLGKLTEAMDQLNYTVELFPDSAIAYAARAAHEKERKIYAAALYDWEQAVRLAPNNADFRLSLVDVLLLMGKRNEARATLDGMVRNGTPRGLLREWYDKCGS